MGNFTIHSWYRTTFDVPSSWTDRTLLNFGAVDYEATVFINGKNVTHHVGGYWSFNVDITDYLSKNGTNELYDIAGSFFRTLLTFFSVVFVFDPTNSAPYNIPVGKQKLIPEHIFYTPCSGIWQTVWLESAPSTSIDKLDINAAADGKGKEIYSLSTTSANWYKSTLRSIPQPTRPRLQSSSSTSPIPRMSNSRPRCR